MAASTWFRGHMYHGENFEKMTQYDVLGCIFLHNYAFSFLIYKHKYIVSVEGYSSIVLHIECLGACSFEKFFKKWHNLMSFSEYSDIILSLNFFKNVFI